MARPREAVLRILGVPPSGWVQDTVYTTSKGTETGLICGSFLTSSNRCLTTSNKKLVELN